MKIGIVGAEGAKFTTEGEARAKQAIHTYLTDINPTVTEVCSGECHLGGIDKWAHEEADRLGLPFTPFPPRENNWSNGYKPRNLQIARWSDKVLCITVDKLPEGFSGMKFDLCYHCAKNGMGDGTDHVKSGGCWTMFKAKELGKEWESIIVTND